MTEATQAPEQEQQTESSLPPARPPVRKWRVFLGVLGLGLLCTGLFVFLFLRDLLAIAADQWIVDQSFHRADAAFILGGGVNERPFGAERYYRLGRVPKVLYAKQYHVQSTRMGLTYPDYMLTLRILKTMGVADEDVVCVGDDVTSTFDEAMRLRDWARTNELKSVVVPTGDFHTRRAAWILNRAFEGSDVKVYVVSVPDRFYDQDEWWRDEKAMINFQNEVVKYVFYRFRYRSLK